MELTKTALTVHGDKVNIAMPFAKVNKQARTVSGFATLDNVDTQGDMVTAEASLTAFREWRGNVREMHAPYAVGKAVDIKEDEVYDPATGKWHKGIFVTVYVSKGAQDTWEKVLDGTLTGFSIGGNVKKSANVFSKESDSPVRKVTEYVLSELSLVDNPANQLANIVSFQKSAGGTVTFDGMVSKMSVENIFYCRTDELAITSEDETYKCSSCGEQMENIGWVEDEEGKTEVVKAAIQKATDAQFASGGLINYNTNTTGTLTTTPSIIINVSGGSPEEIAEQVKKALNTGGVNVSKDELEKSEQAPEQTATNAEAGNEGTAVEGGEAETNVENTQTETAAEVSEVEEPDLNKMFSDLRDTLTTAITTAKTDTEKALTGVQDAFEKSFGEVSTKVSDLESKVGEINKTVDALKESVGDVEKRVDGVEGETAVKKSNDLGGSEDEKVEKTSIWRGAFLGVNDLVK